MSAMDAYDLIDGNYQFFGGLIASTEGSLTQQETSSAEHTSGSSSEDHASKHTTKAGKNASQRGRPRLVSKNQSVGERRRTQIRLAQRAYRQRKEATITDLKRQVENLERKIDEMAHSISAFQQRAIASGIEDTSPTTAQDLKAVVARFKTATKTEALDKSTNCQGPVSPSSARLYLSQDDGHTARTTADQVPTRGTASTLQSSHDKTSSPPVWGYQISEAEDEAEQCNLSGSQQGMIGYSQLDIGAGMNWNEIARMNNHHA